MRIQADSGVAHKYYFVYCESGFRTRILGDYVITAVKTPEPTIMGSVEY